MVKKYEHNFKPRAVGKVNFVIIVQLDSQSSVL